LVTIYSTSFLQIKSQKVSTIAAEENAMAVPFWKSDSFGTALSYAISQMPTFIGYPLADLIGHFAANDVMSPGHRAMRVNQWVAHGGKISPRKLRQLVRQVYYNQGRAIYDFYHYLNHPEKVRRMVSLTPQFKQMMDEAMQGKQGTLLLIAHTAGFNLGGLVLPLLGYKILSLAIANPSRGYRWQNQLRNQHGMEVVPMSVSSWQRARERLQAGGMVQTGVDRPQGEVIYSPMFFGRPAALPVAYTKLALTTGAKVFVAGFHTNPDRTCVIDVSEQVQMEKRDDPHVEMLVNAEKVLREVEKFILRDPTQWMMFLPVWPQAGAELPARFKLK
jgi:lauroyl/myristoyl acyltransferase